MFKAICCALASMILTHSAWAITTDFEDLPNGAVFTNGTLFSSGGLNFKSVPFPATGTEVVVDSLGKASGSGKEISFGRSVGLEFELTSIVSKIDFLFGDYFADSNGDYIGAQFIVNGVSSGRPLVPLDGTTIGGVQIAVKPVNVAGGVTGRLTLTGPIQSLTVGSTNFYLDQVTVTVPEPATAALVLLGGGAMVASARRRRR
jgi:hypothetical protein